MLDESDITEYSDVLGDGRTRYKIDIADELEGDMKNVYGAFSSRFAAWEL